MAFCASPRPRSHRDAGLPRSDLREQWPSRLVATAAENRLSNPPQFSLRLPRLLRKRIISNAWRLNPWPTHESPARTGEKKGGVSRTPHSRPSPGRREGVRVGIIDTLAYTDLTRPQHKRALKVAARSEQRKNHFLGTANCKRVSDSALAFSASGDGS
jgi:hypothetical protein